MVGSPATLRPVPDASGETAEADAALTIDELARETGMTVRTIRAHQARGLLPPPEVRQRTGYYGPEHMARLRLVQELQAEGFNLKGIRRLIDEAPGPAESFLGLKRMATEPFATEAPEVLEVAELAERFGPDVDPRALEQAERLGVLVPLGGDRYEAPSPALLRAAEEVMARGVPLPVALDLVQHVKSHCESTARAFVRLFMENVWKPFEDAGSPPERFADVVESIERLRPLAAETVSAVFGLTMTREVEAAFGKELERRVRKGR